MVDYEVHNHKLFTAPAAPIYFLLRTSLFYHVAARASTARLSAPRASLISAHPQLAQLATLRTYPHSQNGKSLFSSVFPPPSEVHHQSLGPPPKSHLGESSLLDSEQERTLVRDNDRRCRVTFGLHGGPDVLLVGMAPGTFASRPISSIVAWASCSNPDVPIVR